MKMFENKVAVVTGAGGTLCSEIAIRLSLEGAKVILVGRTAEKLQKTFDKITALGGTPAVIHPCDVTDKEAVDIVQMVLAGKINKNLVNLLQSKGGKAIGLCGIDGHMIKAEKFHCISKKKKIHSLNDFLK